VARREGNPTSGGRDSDRVEVDEVGPRPRKDRSLSAKPTSVRCRRRNCC